MAGSQGSFHTEIEDPDPTILISLSLTRDLTKTILRQPYDGEYDRIGSRGDAFLKYHPLKTRENKVFGFKISRHNYLPSISVLKSVRSLKSNPPLSLFKHNLSYDFQ